MITDANAIGSRLAANNVSHLVVTSSPEASPKATQLPDSAHSGNGLPVAALAASTLPALPANKAVAERRPRPCPPGGPPRSATS